MGRVVGFAAFIMGCATDADSADETGMSSSGVDDAESGESGESEGDSNGEDSAGGDVCDENLNWNSVGAPFFLTYCSGCHGSALPEEFRQGAPLNIILDSFENVLPLAVAIQVVLTPELGLDMPPAGELEPGEVASVIQWLSCL